MAARRAALLCLLAACSAAPPDRWTDLEITVEGGVVRGVEAGGVRSFRGIPYAAAPVGENRFRAPQPVVPWEGVREATRVGQMCPQGFNLGPGGGEEDCLFVNVFAPTPAPAQPAPVMVWFHGGAFTFGSGGEAYFDGAGLVAAGGVVVVTVNYRLGALGFLAHPALSAEDPGHPGSGNWGLEDELAALEWVNRHIAAFGGDPARVTIFGESAGGLSACVFYVSPRATGLFQAAISESGPCGAEVTEHTLAEAEAIGVAFAASLGCDGDDVLACLREQPVGPFVEAASLEPRDEQQPGGMLYQDDAMRWRIVVDGAVVPRPVREALAAGGYPPRPFLLGSNRDEGTLFTWSVAARQIPDEVEYRAALSRRFGADAAEAIATHYPAAAYPSPTRALAEVTGDAFFVCPARRTGRALAAAGAPVYLYSFRRELESLLVSHGGAIHTGEIPFVFGVDEFPLGRIGDGGWPLVAAVQGYWTRFATTLDPNGGGAPAWPRYDADGDAHLTLDLEPEVGTGWHRDTCDFWDALPRP